jgi:hypothetical protein
MRRTLIAGASAVAFGVGLATAVAAAPVMKSGPSLGGGANFHAMTPSVGAGPGPGTTIHSNITAPAPNTSFGPRPYNGNWNQSWNQHWSGNWRDHDHDRFRHRHGFFGFGLYAYGPDYYDYGYSCYQRRFVPTPYGWRWRLVWVCGPYY